MSYEKFVLQTVRSQKAPRTLAEAYRTPEYACAIYRFQTENERGAKQLAMVSLHVALFFAVLFVLYGVALWVS